MERLGLRAALTLIVLAAAPAVRADDAATRQLIEQGRFWEQRDQPKRALEAWQRVLQVDPNNTEALSRLAVLSAATGDRGKSQSYLDQLNKLAPASPALGEARRAISSGAVTGDALARARQLAAAKDYPGAVAAYRDAFGGKVPDGAVALEYYQTLGATADGWSAARDGLAELARAHPDDPRYTLAYAQHLTYREPSRRDGIDRLAALAQNPASAAQARPAWRQALIWLQAQPSDAERYKRYLGDVGADDAVQARMQGLRSATVARPEASASAAEGKRVREIFDQINGDDLDGAQANIDQLLQQSPRSADGHGALGVLRLRQGRYDDAVSSLKQAQSEAPRTAGRWRDALRAASFWQHVQRAQAARDAGDGVAAENEYESAFSQAPADAPDATRVAYADVLIERHHDAAAEKIEREVLRRSPDNPDALRGLITVLARNGRGDEAMRLSNGAPPNVQQQLSGVRADQLRARAAAERDAGQLPQAQGDLERALLLDPESPWIRLDLANVLRAQGHPEQAQTLLDGLAASNGDLPQVRMAQAYAAGNSGDWQQTLQILQQLPPDQRPPDAYVLQRRAWVNYQMQRVKAAIAAHQPAEGYAIIDQAADAAGNNPELLGAVASGWAQLGDPARAVATMRRAIDRSPNADPAMRIQYAALLLTAGQDGEFEVVADDIATRGILSAQQQQDLDTLVVGYRVKLADRARTNGKLAEAYVQLRDVIARYPNDSRVQLALARLLAASGDVDQSSAIYQAQLAASPDSDDIRLGLIDARLAASDQEGARSLIKQGLKAHPDEPRYWQASARLAEAEHRRGDALEAYRRAQSLQANAAVAAPMAPPQLTWLDPSRPDQALPAAVANALSEVAPSTGPLRPRASEVALPPGPLSGSGSGSAMSVAPLPIAQGSGFAPAAVGAGCQSPSAGQSVDLSGCRVGDTIVLRGVEFETAQARLVPAATGLLNEFASALRARPDLKIEIDGHTDGNGSDAYNQRLSERRASSVRAYLIKHGVGADRISARGFGKSMPLADNDSDEGRERNRRVEAKVTDAGGLPMQAPPSYPAAQSVPGAAPPAASGGYLSKLEQRLGVGADRSGWTQPQAPPQLQSSQQLPAGSAPIAAPSADGAPPPPPPTVADNIGRLEAETSGWAGGALTTRSRAGQAGLGQLSDIEVPLQFRTRETRAGRFGVDVTPVYLDAGSASGSDKLNYGSVALIAGANASNGGSVTTPDVGNVPLTSSAGGAAFDFNYNYGPLTADIGTTPLGFIEQRLVGGLKLGLSPGDWRLGLDLSRRAVTESLLSYAGEKDPLTGKNFGGVTRTGGRGDVTYDAGNFGLYANGGFFTLDGHNVDNNTEITGGAGVYAKALNSDTMSLTYGLNLTGFSYDKNLRYFTFGHGGYFSPQLFLALTVPIEWSGRHGNLTYDLKAALGVQSFREDGNELYPGFGSLNDALQQVIATEPSLNIPKGYSSQRVSGLGYAFGGAAEYRLLPRLSLGGQFGIDNARDYRELQLNAYLRYYFDEQSLLLPQSPTPILPIYGQ